MPAISKQPQAIERSPYDYPESTSSSKSEEDIPAKASPIRKSPLRRPSLNSVPTLRSASLKRRQGNDDVGLHLQQEKRLKGDVPPVDVTGPQEAQPDGDDTDDDDIDAVDTAVLSALNAFAPRSSQLPRSSPLPNPFTPSPLKNRIEVVLHSGKKSSRKSMSVVGRGEKEAETPGHDGVSTETENDQTPGRLRTRLHALTGRNTSTVQETPQPEVTTRVLHPNPVIQTVESPVNTDNDNGNEDTSIHIPSMPSASEGSPELQSSATKRRQLLEPSETLRGVSEATRGDILGRVASINGLRESNQANESEIVARVASSAVSENSFPSPSRLRRTIRKTPRTQPSPLPRPTRRSPASTRIAPAQRLPAQRAMHRNQPTTHQQTNDFNGFDESEEFGLDQDDEGEPLVNDSPESSSHRAYDDVSFDETDSTNDFKVTINIPRETLDEMFNLMGQAGWTGNDDDWEEVLLTNPESTLTAPGLRFYERLERLKFLLDSAPRGPDLFQQKEWFQRKQAESAKVNFDIETSVDEFCSMLQDDIPVEERTELLEDLLQGIIPMLIITLQSSFALGGVVENDSGDLELKEEGDFSGITLQCLMDPVVWIDCLYEVLAQEQELDRIEDGDDDESRDEGKVRKLQQKRLKDPLDHLVKILNEGSRIMKLYEDKARDEAARLAREKEQEKEFAKARERELAWCLSTKQLRNKPSPMAELWRKATAGTDLAPASSESRNRGVSTKKAYSSAILVAPGGRGRGYRLPSSSQRTFTQQQEQRQQSLSSAEPVASRTRVPRPRVQALGGSREQRQPMLKYAPWPNVDLQFLLNSLRQLRVPVNREFIEECAELLDRPIDQVRQEVYKLQQSAKRLTLKKGGLPEIWFK